MSQALDLDRDASENTEVTVGGGDVEPANSSRLTMPIVMSITTSRRDTDRRVVEETFGVHVHLQDRVTGRLATEDQRRSEQSAFSKRVAALLKISKKVSPEMEVLRQQLGANVNVTEFAPLGEVYAIIEYLNRKDRSPHRSLQTIIAKHSLDQFIRAAAWKGSHFPEPLRSNSILLDFPEAQRMELLRQKVIFEHREQQKKYHEVKNEIIDPENMMTLMDAIAVLEENPSSSYERTFQGEHADAKSLDLPISSSPENTRLHRALLALRNEYEAQLSQSPDIDTVQRQTREFVLAILNPTDEVRFSNITDVYGSEPDVPGSQNDATRLRVAEHRREIEEVYGIKLEVSDQGTTIKCPEQCGFDALISLNQARRRNPGKRIAPRFFALNNAARTEDMDHLQGAEASKSTGLMYFTFDLGDGVLHSGTAYGHQTLTYLKPYIKDLYEIQGADAGTQFRSLEFQQHITTLVGMANGAFPACYKGKKLNKNETILTPELAENEFQYMGMDKYGNGVTSISAEKVFAQFLSEGEQKAQVKVTILDRMKNPLDENVNPKTYTMARSLGLVRDGSPALWKSSTPTTDNPKDGYLSIGMFMQKPGDTNGDVIRMPAGSIIRIEKI